MTSTGELQVQIMQDGGPTVTLTTKGAGLNSAVNVDHDVVINLDNGKSCRSGWTARWTAR